MLNAAEHNPPSVSNTQNISQAANNLVSRKIWLPKLLYDAVPYFYVVAGLLAFLATLYISEWFWVLPHYLLFSAACIHLGILIYRRRGQKRKLDLDSSGKPQQEDS